MTNLSIIRSVVVPLSIFVTGLLAGVMLGVAMEQQTAQKLPEAAWTLRQQNDDGLFRKVMPFTFITMMLLLIASIFLLHGRSRMAMAAATVSALAVIIVTAGWEVPINNEIVKWTPGNAPADRMSTRDRWLHNHWVRTWIGVLAFGCTLVSTLRITD
jgi:Na+/H+ antiporter NhaB